MATEKAFPWVKLVSLVLPIIWLLLRHFGIELPEGLPVDSITYLGDLGSAAVGGGAIGNSIRKKA